jgi:hypothetical protein
MHDAFEIDAPVAPVVWSVGAAEARGATAAPVPRRRGRPPLMSRQAVLDRIRTIAARGDGLVRIHHTHGSLYARARRMFGSWRAAVAAAGEDYHEILLAARRRSMRSRRARGRVRT